MVRRKDDEQERGGRGGEHRGNAYPVRERLAVIREVLRGHLSVNQIARAFGISRTTIDSWLSAYDRDGIEGLTPCSSGASASAAGSMTSTHHLDPHPECRYDATGDTRTVVVAVLLGKQAPFSAPSPYDGALSEGFWAGYAWT
jgi:transposase-like protein